MRVYDLVGGPFAGRSVSIDDLCETVMLPEGTLSGVQMRVYVRQSDGTFAYDPNYVFTSYGTAIGPPQPKERVPVPAGELVAVTYGRYSSYAVVSHLRTLREVDFDAELASYLERHPGEAAEYSLSEDRFVAELVASGAAEPTRAWEVHLDDYEYDGNGHKVDVTSPEET